MKDNIFKCGYISIIGLPNAGKSTLLNSIIGKKISIVTHKAQTTRTQIKAILTKDSAQLIFIDTPGMFKPKKHLDGSLLKEAWKSLEQASLVLLIIDSARKINDEVFYIIEELKKNKIEVVVVLNKIDLTNKTKLLNVINTLKDKFEINDIYLISAINFDGINDLVKMIVKKMPNKEWVYAKDLTTDISDEFIAEEFTREKVFKFVHKEIPYSININTDLWQKSDRGLQINQNIYVENKNHKKILLGKDGEKIKQISIESRKDIEKYFKKKVHLYLYIKIRKNNNHIAGFSGDN
tara:strand:+ start:9482 stop:10363 length:882 start_codon:yes stop_codon:yes gene_type:complete